MVINFTEYDKSIKSQAFHVICHVSQCCCLIFSVSRLRGTTFRADPWKSVRSTWPIKELNRMYVRSRLQIYLRKCGTVMIPAVNNNTCCGAKSSVPQPITCYDVLHAVISEIFNPKQTEFPPYIGIKIKIICALLIKCARRIFFRYFCLNLPQY